MKKRLLFLTLAVLLIPTILAIDLSVTELTKNNVMIIGLNQPTVFNLSIINNAYGDQLLFYTFFGSDYAPQESVSIPKDTTKVVEFKVYPRDDWKGRGITNFYYFIQAKDGSEVKEQLTVNIIDLGDAFEIGSGDVNPESNSIELYIKNKVNYNFEDLSVRFKSAFFTLDQQIALGPYEKKVFTIQLDKADYNKLLAGYYTMNSQIMYQSLKSEVEGKINFVEKNILTTSKRTYGWVINTQIIQKVNEGNTIETSQTILKKNIVSRLFTTFSPEPNLVERQGLDVYYTWNQKISPGETSEITVKTNWLFPFLIIFFLILVAVLAKRSVSTSLAVKKRIGFVKAKGGEFALKITLTLEAKNYVENIKLIDRLPPLVKMYERFGGEDPQKFDKANNQLEWDFLRLDKGERRLVSYIVYSRIGVLGKFALPPAVALFERNGKIKEVESNKAFFLSQPRGNDDFD